MTTTAESPTTIPSLRGKLRQRLGPTNFWYDIELEDALMEALRLWQVMTGSITRTFKTAPQGMQYETCPGQLARPVRVTFGGAGGDLDLISLWELDEGFSGWEGEAGGAPEYWGQNGFNQFVFYPRATLALGEVSIEGIADLDYGWRRGVDLEELSSGDEEALLGYAQHYLSFKEGQGEMDNTGDLLKNFFERAAAANQRLRRTNFYRASMGADAAEVEGSRSTMGKAGGMR